MVNTISEYIVYSNKIVLHNSQITYLREGQLTLPLTSPNTTQRELTLTTIHRLRSGTSRCCRDARSALSHHTSTAGPEYTTEGVEGDPNALRYQQGLSTYIFPQSPSRIVRIHPITPKTHYHRHLLCKPVEREIDFTMAGRERR